MQKFISLLSALLLFCFSGCVYERYEKPSYTQVAHSIYYSAAKCNLDLYVGSFNLLLKADQWLKAPDEKTRYEIEDTWFSYYKLRTNGDTLQLVGLYNIDLITIVTGGKSLLTPGTEWKMTVTDKTLRYQCTDADSWILSHSESSDIGSHETRLSIQRETTDPNILSLTITGTGYGFVIPSLRKYEIRDKLYIEYLDRNIYPSPIRSMKNGALTIELADEPTPELEKVVLRFSNTGSYTISFMGETNEGWWFYY